MQGVWLKCVKPTSKNVYSTYFEICRKTKMYKPLIIDPQFTQEHTLQGVLDRLYI